MGCNWVFTVHSRAKYLNFMKFFVTNFYLTFHQKNEEFPTNFKPHDFFMIQESSNLNCVHENSMFNLPSNFKSFHITNWLRKSNESSYPHSWKNLIFHLVRYLLFFLLHLVTIIFISSTNLVLNVKIENLGLNCYFAPASASACR